MSLIDLGEDILVSNVARYLRPIDILHLSMTCKDMRSNFETNDAYHMLYSKIFGSKPTPLSIENYDWKHLFHLRTSRAKLYTWGSPEQGRLGYLVNEIPPDHVITNGFRKGVCLPTNVVPFNQLVVSDISAGGFSFQILTNDGDLYYTGGRWKRLQSLGQLTPGPVNGRDYNPSMGSGSLYFPTPLPSLLQARARRMVGPGVAPPPDMARRYGREMNNRASMERTADSDNLTRPPEAQPALSKRVPSDAKFVTKLDLPDVLDGQSIEARSIISVSSGREHFIALDNQNGIYSWDTGNTTNIGVRITFPGIDPRKQITKISCGWNLSACHIKGVGIVVWYAREAVSEDSFEAKKLLAPARYVVIPGTNEYTPRDFLAGLDYVLIIDNDGKLLRFDIHAQSYANGSIDPSLAAKPFFVNSFNTWAEKKSEAGQAPTFTKLSGCYNLFAIFASDGLVVIGNKTITAADNEDGEPVVIPELQGRGVIDMAMGDYHYLALTDRGELLTWGRESSLCGCLGLGSKETFLSEHPEASGDSGSDIVANKPVVVKKPEEKGEWLAIAAAGWHSGGIFVCTGA